MWNRGNAIARSVWASTNPLWAILLTTPSIAEKLACTHKHINMAAGHIQKTHVCFNLDVHAISRLRRQTQQRLRTRTRQHTSGEGQVKGGKAAASRNPQQPRYPSPWLRASRVSHIVPHRASRGTQSWLVHVLCVPVPHPVPCKVGFGVIRNFRATKPGSTLCQGSRCCASVYCGISMPLLCSTCLCRASSRMSFPIIRWPLLSLFLPMSAARWLTPSGAFRHTALRHCIPAAHILSSGRDSSMGGCPAHFQQSEASASSHRWDAGLFAQGLGLPCCAWHSSLTPPR